MAAECPVCCSGFTDRLRRRVACAYCDFTACASCVQSYLLNSPSDPRCMSCGAGWNREFLDAHLTRAFVHGPLKAHRETVLLEREKALLPESQTLLENYRIARALSQNVDDNERELRNLRQRAAQLQRDISHDRARAARIVADRYRTAGFLGTSGADAPERRTFTRACPVDGCRGFLSTAHKCGTCETWACAACLEPRGPDRESPHECDPAVLASARLIARDSRPCPSCASLIYKIDGCDQMWCTVCRTAFSWRTGALVTTHVHNPHYYEWIRSRGGEVPRAPGDAPPGGACPEGLPGAWDLDGAMRRFVDEPRRRFVAEFHRVVRHVQGVELRRLRAAFDADDNTDLRLGYLLQHLDEDEFARKLQQREKRRERDLAVRQIFEMYIAAATDAFNGILAAARGGRGPEVLEGIRVLAALTRYVNDQVASVQRRFNMTVSGWNPVWARNLLRNAAEAAGEPFEM